MSKYIALGLIVAVLLTLYSHDPLGEAVKGIGAGLFTWIIISTWPYKAE